MFFDTNFVSMLFALMLFGTKPSLNVSKHFVISYFHRAHGVVTTNQTFMPHIYCAHGAVNLVYSNHCAHGVVTSD